MGETRRKLSNSLRLKRPTLGRSRLDLQGAVVCFVRNNRYGRVTLQERFGLANFRSCPGVNRISTGVPKLLTDTWTFVEKPPRDRPNTPCSGPRSAPCFWPVACSWTRMTVLLSCKHSMPGSWSFRKARSQVTFLAEEAVRE